MYDCSTLVIAISGHGCYSPIGLWIKYWGTAATVRFICQERCNKRREAESRRKKMYSFLLNAKMELMRHRRLLQVRNLRSVCQSCKLHCTMKYWYSMRPANSRDVKVKIQDFGVYLLTFVAFAAQYLFLRNWRRSKSLTSPVLSFNWLHIIRQCDMQDNQRASDTKLAASGTMTLRQRICKSRIGVMLGFMNKLGVPE